MTTPPTDDEREALAAAEFPEGEFTNRATILAFREAYLRGFDVGLSRQRPAQEHVGGLVVSRRNMENIIRERDAAREALANTMRRRGPITGPAVGRVWVALFANHPTITVEQVRAALEAARDAS